MFKKYGVRIQLTIYIAILLLISNLLLLLSYYVLFMNAVEFHNFNSNLLMNQQLVLWSVGILLVTTSVAVVITYFVLGDLFVCLDSLSKHMKKVNRRNIVQKIKIKSKIKEVESLIGSFNSMMNKIDDVFNTQKNFSNYIAHELRTPLATMQMNIDVYKKQQNNSLELIDDIESQIAKMSQLVNKILELTEIQRTKLRDLIVVDLLFDELFDDLEGLLEEKNINLTIQLENEGTIPDLQVLGDHTLLYQAFFNIIENSIKYNQENGTILILISNQAKNINIKIKDDGCGISKEDSELIFEAFYRANTSQKLKKGYGIGLTFTKKVIEHHGGNIQYNPQEIGSEFEINLPKYQ